jgi:hypothetical protein
MGRKYANIHICTREQDKILLTVQDFYNNRNTKESSKNQALKSLHNINVQIILEKIKQLSAPELLIVQSESFISIYDEVISFEIIEKNAKMLSDIVGGLVIYISNFDDDVLLFGLYRSGKLVTNGKIGEGLSFYGISSEIIDIDKFCKELDIKRTDSMDCFNDLENISDVEDELETILQMPLDLSLRDIEEYDILRKKNNRNGIQIYEKIK